MKFFIFKIIFYYSGSAIKEISRILRVFLVWHTSGTKNMSRYLPTSDMPKMTQMYTSPSGGQLSYSSEKFLFQSLIKNQNSKIYLFIEE